jgi:hypothetical protein
MFEISGETVEKHRWLVRRPLRGLFHWLQKTDHYKLTTPLDLWKRRMNRYGVAPAVGPGGNIPTFARRKTAEEVGRTLSSWGTPYRILWHDKGDLRWVGFENGKLADPPQKNFRS